MRRIIYIFLATWLYGDVKFEDLISKAVNHYPSIQMSEEAYKMSEEEVKNAMWQYFPTPSVDLSRSSKNDELVTKIEQPLWTGGRLDAQYNLAISARTEAGYLIEENKFKLIERILNLLQIYSQGKSAEKSLQEGYNRLSKFSEMLDNRFESGMSSLSDKKLLNSRLTQIKSELINAKAKQDVSLKQLSLLVGEKIDKIDFDLNRFYFEDKHTNLLIDNMIKYHPSLNKLDEQIKASIYEVDKEQSALYPTISLTAEHTSGNIYDKESTESDNAIYLSLRASTGAGLSILSKIEKARVNTKKLQAEKNLKEKELSDSILTDYNNMIVAKEKIDNLKENQELSAEIFESNKRLFIAGRKQWLDLVNSSKELMDISVSHQETKELYAILKYKIALQTGLININTGDIQDNKIEKKLVNDFNITKNIKTEEPIFSKKELIKEILFEKNKSEINEKFIADLKDLVDYMNDNKTFKLELIGHIDKAPKEKAYLDLYNKTLAQKRATEIANWLVKNGIDSTRISISNKKEVVEQEFNKKVTLVLSNFESLPSSEIVTQKKQKENSELIKNLTFKRNEIEIDKKYIYELKETINFMHKNADYSLELIGHSDKTSVSKKDYNDILAKKRAQNVANFLISNGLEPIRIRISSKGYDVPAATNDSIEGNELNRRVEFIFSKNK